MLLHLNLKHLGYITRWFYATAEDQIFRKGSRFKFGPGNALSFLEADTDDTLEVVFLADNRVELTFS